MNKRMAIGITGMAFDVLGMGEIIFRYQEYSKTGAYPQPGGDSLWNFGSVGIYHQCLNLCNITPMRYLYSLAISSYGKAHHQP